MGRSTVHYADSDTNNILKKLHNKLRPAGTPVQRVEYIIELLLLRIFEVKLKQDPDFKDLRKLFTDQNEDLLFSSLYSIGNERLLPVLNEKFFPFYASILSQARSVYKKNLSQKVQDQLVLIEEVFKNSNFTNNVKSGNLQEVLGLIGEIDEGRLLKTDLLGDAIESALSETGGTKDIGLHRTPDHIRQFMTAVAGPTFEDTIFDPACGTAGFLFDTFGYVLESVSQEGHWPGAKAHPEIQSYFRKYFAGRKTPMPSQDKAITFYRTGISGIEYLGMIRKMAAINFYIRGLNPQNIEQGDSLAVFDPVKDGGSKTVVLANPPFGAERDQEAYANVWEEYPRESETTILFVKLMLDALSPGGRCAVIVSEGFLTWDQTSARTLRKMLIENADLRAVISLPQGVFVSKGGVGPKTSILVFEKNGPTRKVWFYKVTNDGYTMGTNRRPIEGCQLVEALELYDNHVRHGKNPPETKHSFSVPADWILTLDPRVKRRVEEETTADFSEKAKKERRKLDTKLAAQVKKNKITQRVMGEKLVQHDEIWKNKTLNEIAKRIEKAHLYSFNLPNYRSTLSKRQLEEWNVVFNSVRRTNGRTLDTRFAALRNCPLEKAHSALALFDVQNALEFDIAREYLMNFPVEDIEKHNQLATLRKIIQSGAKYPRVRLSEYLLLNRERIKPSNFPDIRFRVLGVSNTEGVFLNETKPGAEIKQAYYRVKPNEFCYNPYRANVGSIGLNEFDYDNQIISGAYNVFGADETELLPQFLMALFKSPRFLAYVNEKAHGGVRMNFKFEDLEEWEIPLPSITRQERIIEDVRRCQAIIKSANQFLTHWRLDPSMFAVCEPKPLRTVLLEATNGLYKPASEYGEGVPIVRITDYTNGMIINGTSELQRVATSEAEIQKYGITEGDILLNRVNSLEHVGKVSLIGPLTEPTVYESNMMRLRVNSDHALPMYIFYALTTQPAIEQIRQKSKRAIGQVSVNQTDVHSVCLPLPEVAEQKRIIEAVKRQNDVCDGIRKAIERAQIDLNDMIQEAWAEQ